MKTLGLSVVTDPAGGRDIVAMEVGGDCTPLSGSTGNIEDDEGEKIFWKNCGEDWQDNGAHTFLVTFERKTIPGKWPFDDPKKPKDETLPVPPPYGAEIETTLKNVAFKQQWKYEAVVQHDSSIGALDPMIIIRNRNVLDTVALAVGAAILIAAVVYLFRRTLLRR